MIEYFMVYSRIDRAMLYYMETAAEIKQKLITAFCDSFDLVCVEGALAGVPCLYSFFDGMTDRELLENGIIAPFTNLPSKAIISTELLNSSSYSSASAMQVESFEEGIKEIVNGNVLLYVQNIGYYSFNLLKLEKRSVQEPPTSSVLKGPRSGFVEEIAVNTTLLRRRLKTKDLIIQKCTVGKYTQTTVGVCWLSGIANKKMVDMVIQRINAISVDGVIDSSYIAMFIEDNKSSIFSQISSQEKPDIVVGKMLEGRVAIIVDGSPMVLTLPYLLLESFQDSEDYFRRSHRVSFIRILRLLGLILSTLLPAAYVAVQEYQYQFIPLKFMITIINATSGTPFTPTYEMILVLLVFDILNEASIRMPKYVGMALSVVGAIVLGETAVKAGLLSSPAVLVMALSAIGMYTAPSNMGTFSLIRLLFLVAASFFGMPGLVLSLILMLCGIATLKSFGTDFTAPYAPLVASDLKDGFLKRSLTECETRPNSIPQHNSRRKS